MSRKEITAIIGNWRYWALCVIAMIATVGIFSDTADNLTLGFVLIKAVGIAAAYAFYCLFRYWACKRKIDELLKLIQD